MDWRYWRAAAKLPNRTGIDAATPAAAATLAQKSPWQRHDMQHSSDKVTTLLYSTVRPYAYPFSY